MSSIRQLAGASTFGPSSLDIHNLGGKDDEKTYDNTNKGVVIGNRRRSRTTDYSGGDSFALLHRSTAASHHFNNVAGDIITSAQSSSVVLQSSAGNNNSDGGNNHHNVGYHRGLSGSSFSSFKRSLRNLYPNNTTTNNNNTMMIESTLSEDSLSSSPSQRQHRMSPIPIRSSSIGHGIVLGGIGSNNNSGSTTASTSSSAQRIRAATWDTAMQKFSPLARKHKKGSSFDRDDYNVAADQQQQQQSTAGTAAAILPFESNTKANVDGNNNHQLDNILGGGKTTEGNLFKLSSEYAIEDFSDSDYSDNGNDDENDDEEPIIDAAMMMLPTPKANNLTMASGSDRWQQAAEAITKTNSSLPSPDSEAVKRFHAQNSLDDISDINPAFSKNSSQSMSLSSIGTSSRDDAVDGEESKVEEGDEESNNSLVITGAAAAATGKKDRKVSFAPDHFDSFDTRRGSFSHQISYNTDVSFMDESISTVERHKHFGSQPHQQEQNTFMNKFFNPCKCLSWSLIGSYIIRTAPCFWCMKRVGISATDRQIVIRLNVLIVFFCLVQIGAGIFVLTTVLIGYFHTVSREADTKIYYEEGNDNRPLITQDLWSLTTFVYFLSLMNFVLLIAAMLAQRAIRYVNLAKSVRYMWALFWILPLQVFFMIGLFDYNQVMEVWTKHWWDDPTLAWYREIFCDEGTAHGKCMVPVLGGSNYPDEQAWCVAYYNATDCEDIREEAQRDFIVTHYVYFTVNGIWALLLALIMWVTLNVLQAVITLPIVQRSKESNIPLWLSFPIVGSYMIGYVLLFSSTSVDETLEDIRWMGIAYMVTGGAFTLAALIGIVLKCYPVLNTRQKKVKQSLIVLFIIMVVLTIFTVAVVFTTSLIYSLNIVDLPLTRYSDIACSLDVDGTCTGCDSTNPEEVCPEWSKDDVARVLQTITKQSATIAAIFLVYALASLRHGFVLFRHVSRYQIEYV